MKTDCTVNKQMTTILIQVYYHHIHLFCQITYTYWMTVLYFKTQCKETLVLKWIDSFCHVYDP